MNYEEFRTERTKLISEMFDNVDEYGIYPTAMFFEGLDKIFLDQEKQIKELKEYARHMESCNISVLSHPEDCTCGLTKLLNKH